MVGFELYSKFQELSTEQKLQVVVLIIYTDACTLYAGFLNTFQIISGHQNLFPVLVLIDAE